MLLSLDAAANGLVLEIAETESSEGFLGLVPLRSLTIDVTIDNTVATVAEERTYALHGVGEVATGTVTYYRSVGPDAVATDFVLGPDAVEGTILDPDEADEVRIDLVERLRNPGPLRELGFRLFVSEPVQIEVDPWSASVSLSIGLEQSLTPWDTMHGLALTLDWHGQPVGSMTVNVQAETEEPLRALYSPFHQLSLIRDGANRATGTFYGSSVCTTLDLTLLISTGDEPVHLDVLPFRYSDVEGGFFMALLTPDATPTEQAVMPRDLVIVLDISGSMRGAKIAQAKEALHAVLDGLGPEDSFAIVTFNTVINSYLDNAVLAAPAQVDAAKAFVDGLAADSGTNIYDALQSGFRAMPLGTDHPRYVLLLTDGEATEGETDTEAILEMARRQNEIHARIFTFGIGPNVNTVLLDRLGMDSAGDAFYIRPGESVTEAVAAFFEQIVDPILANPELDFSAFGSDAIYPAVLPDLFAGQTVSLIGRFSQHGTSEVQLRGVVGGNPEATIYRVTMPELSQRNHHVPRIWATRHVGTLLHQVKLGNDDPALVDEALAAANRFGVVTEFTYFRIDDEGNARMVYSEVPVDVTGSVAVETSSSLDGYSESGGVNTSTGDAAILRFWTDRSLALVDGYSTDTVLEEDEEWVDLHFGSEQYFAFATLEAEEGSPGFLSMGRNLRFEWLGRAIRVTDAEDEERENVPDETENVPSPVFSGADAPGLVEVLETNVPIEADQIGPGGLDRLPGELEEDPATGCACSATHSRSGGSALLVIVIGLGLIVLRRRSVA
jgi:Ca-activated chloride channel family protein